VNNRLRPRRVITVGEVINFLSNYPDSTPVYCSVSEVNLDEPVETQEFILEEGKRKCVAVESNGRQIVFGYVE